MRKFGIIALTIVLTLALSACGGRGNTDTTGGTEESTTRTTTEATVIPSMPDTDTTMDTNIPDPTVDSNSNGGMMGSTDDTAGTDSTYGNGGTNGESGGIANGSGISG